MKTNIVDALERNARAGEKWIVPKSQLTMLLLVCAALAVGGCETLESSILASQSQEHRFRHRRLLASRPMLVDLALPPA
jgi:hypothetical protein